MAAVDSEVQKELFDKISKNDVSGVKNIFTNYNLKPDIYDENNMTPLQHAAYRGNKELVRFLLDQGANVNSGKHEYGYTALHFAALSGNPEVCQLLLENGAKTHATNSVDRTPSQMAAFVGNHACVVVINNFVPKSDIEYYTQISGFETEPKLPPHLVEPLHKFVMEVNLHPVKIAFNVQKSVPLYENIEKVVKVLRLMSEREMKRGIETNEIMSFKFHYLACVLNQILKCKNMQLPEKSEKKKDETGEKERKKVEPVELFIKSMLIVNKDSTEHQDSFLTECITEFPYRECTILQQIVSTLSRPGSPSPLTVITCAINGRRVFKMVQCWFMGLYMNYCLTKFLRKALDRFTLPTIKSGYACKFMQKYPCGAWCGQNLGFLDSDTLTCATCGEEKATKKCSNCKSVQYCDRECQRLHWFVHKKSCSQLAKGSSKSEASIEKEKQEAVNAATDALVSELKAMKAK